MRPPLEVQGRGCRDPRPGGGRPEQDRAGRVERGHTGRTGPHQRDRVGGEGAVGREAAEHPGPEEQPQAAPDSHVLAAADERLEQEAESECARQIDRDRRPGEVRCARQREAHECAERGADRPAECNDAEVPRGEVDGSPRDAGGLLRREVEIERRILGAAERWRRHSPPPTAGPGRARPG
ncbi:hypothetical protein GCM10025866_19400 [Naasia aerilata]|uniref:Uncharacterized protein n=1 Tax=Naasia aerilata TaxID=1162966 RepID=A0ABM8GCR1_9MICO|nr:hypothetical protein GCM10025866_19400 [Naasia aerilata]